MKLRFKDQPSEWRKSALLPALGLACLSSMLRWRHHLTPGRWQIALALLGLVAVGALARPRWFRGWYRLSTRLGFFMSQWIGRGLLAGFFVCILTPAGWGMRLLGKDALQLRRPDGKASYWQTAREFGPLDRLF